MSQRSTPKSSIRTPKVSSTKKSQVNKTEKVDQSAGDERLIRADYAAGLFENFFSDLLCNGVYDFSGHGFSVKFILNRSGLR